MKRSSFFSGFLALLFVLATLTGCSADGLTGANAEDDAPTEQTTSDGNDGNRGHNTCNIDC